MAVTPISHLPAERWQRLLIGAAILAFVVLATYRLDRPGLYADEMLFGPAALRAAGQCGVDAGVTGAIGRCFPTYLDPPYLGPLKAWLHVAPLKLFGASVWTLRLPSILFSALGLALLFGVLRRAVSPTLATAAVVVLAFDPMFVFMSRFDWGPVVLSTLFRILLLGALWRWLDGGRPRDLAWAAAFSILGLYDKLNFVWTLIAFTVAVFAVDGRRAVAHLRAEPRACLRVLAPTAAILAWFLVRKILPATRMDLGNGVTAFDAAVQWTKLVSYYNDTFGATFPRNWMGEQPVPIPAWPWRMLMLEFAAVALVASRQPWRIAGLAGRWRALAFVAIALAALLLQMWATRQLAGAHHLFSAWPFPTLLLILLIDLGVAWVGVRWPSARRRDAITALAAAALVLVALPVHAQQRGLWRGQFGFRSPLDPAITALSEAINRRPEGNVITIDWGLHEPLVMLAPKRQRMRFHSHWPSFNAAFDALPGHSRWMRDTYFARGSNWLVSFAAGREVFVGTRRHLAGFVADWGGCLTLDEAIPGFDGKPEYEIWRYDADRQCPAAEVPASLTAPTP